MRYRVTERQVITYEWFVDADTPDEAEGSAEDGVPQDAAVAYFASETSAEPDFDTLADMAARQAARPEARLLADAAAGDPGELEEATAIRERQREQDKAAGWWVPPPGTRDPVLRGPGPLG